MIDLTRRRSHGFSLIEVLVSLLITMIGILGMVALQSKAIPYTQDSAQRNTAIMLADDLVDLIRTAGACTSGNGCVVAPGSSFPAEPSKCSPTPSALKDQIGCWAGQAGRALPGGTDLLAKSFYICRSNTPGDATASACATDSTVNTEVEIQIAWTVKTAAECMVPNNSTTTCTYRIRTRLP